MTCSSCGAESLAGDTFCEACGADLAPPSSPSLLDVPPASPIVDDPTADGDPTADVPRTHLLTPTSGTDGVDLDDEFGVDVFAPCAACGAAVADDGFCTQCGHKARTRREHWTETHGDHVGAVCDRGITHARNEDAMATAVTDAGLVVLVVCDGVTTAPDSDRASLAASRAARDVLAANPPVEGAFAARLSAWERTLHLACRAANGEAVAVARALGDPPEPPSCTFVAAVVDRDLVATAWCGDSRAYWLPDGAPGEQLSLDHSRGTEMIRRGMARSDAEADATSHTITRWLGADSLDPTPEFRALAVDRPGWLLVCSDGLWNEASEPERLQALMADAAAAGATSPTALAESLAAFANERGGRDNITVALARCVPQLP